MSLKNNNNQFNKEKTKFGSMQFFGNSKNFEPTTPRPEIKNIGNVPLPPSKVFSSKNYPPNTPRPDIQNIGNVFPKP